MTTCFKGHFGLLRENQRVSILQKPTILPMNLHKYILGAGLREMIEPKSVTLDESLQPCALNFHRIKLLVLDLQGVEFEVLQGASKLMTMTDFSTPKSL